MIQSPGMCSDGQDLFLDLREKVAFVERGHPRREATGLFGVTPSFVGKLGHPASVRTQDALGDLCADVPCR